jgi:hypothetical protein
MQRRVMLTSALIAATVLSGCAHTYLYPSQYTRYPHEDFTKSHVDYFPAGYDLLLNKCESPTLLPTGQWVEPKCVPITIQSTGEEAYRFELRVKVRSGVGIPYGRMPVDVVVAGSRERCEALRQAVGAKGTPTEPCQGPVFFRRN